MTKRIQKIRFVHLLTILLIFARFPNGLVLFLHKIFAPLDRTTVFVNYIAKINVLGYTALILCPFPYVFMLEDIFFPKLFLPYFLISTCILPVVVVENSVRNQPKPSGGLIQ